jgi:hypothetical protein
MIQIARPRVPRAKFVNASFLNYQFPPCNAVTALGEVLGYLLDPENSELTLGRLFQRIYAALEAGGVLVFDLMEVGTDKSRRQGFWEGDGWTCLVDFRYDQQLDQLQRRIVTFRRVGSTYRRHEETHRLQLYRAGEIAARLREIGFRVRTVRQFGEYPLQRGRVGFIARKA